MSDVDVHKRFSRMFHQVLAKLVVSKDPTFLAGKFWRENFGGKILAGKVGSDLLGPLKISKQMVKLHLIFEIMDGCLDTKHNNTQPKDTSCNDSHYMYKNCENGLN